MQKVSKILLLTDFSEVSENATWYALKISGITQAEVKILHVINTPVEWNKISLEQEKLYPETRAEISDAKSKINKLTQRFDDKGIISHPLLVFNLGTGSIAEFIDFDGIDLIIIGSHGTKGIMEFSLGSNTQKILRSISKPILVVKNPPPREEIRHMVFASTFGEKQRNALNKVLGLSNLLSSKLDLLFINTPYSFKETQETDILFRSVCEKDKKIICANHTLNANNEIRGIKYFMQKYEMDIFSIATGSKSGLTQFFIPSLTETLINHLEIPVLSIHRKQQ